MINTNGEGVAICRCGAELHVVCSGGCADPDVVFKNAIAALPVPRRRKSKPIWNWKGPGFCNFKRCDDPVAPPRKGHQGRQTLKCPKHTELVRTYHNRYLAKRAARA